MDRGGTATAITSIYSGTHLAEHPDARKIARESNEYAARMMQDYPGRFGMFAALPMLLSVTAGRLIDRCKELGLYAPKDEVALALEVGSYLASLVTNHLYTGRFKRSV